MIKRNIAAGLATVAVVALFIFQFLSNSRLREQNRVLTEQVAQLHQIAVDAAQATAPRPDATPRLADDQSRELLRLRGEVGILKSKLAEEVTRRTRDATTQVPDSQLPTDSGDQQLQLARARMNYTMSWMQAFSLYAAEHDGQCPTDFGQAFAFLPGQGRSETNLTPDQFEIVYQGSLTSLTNRGNIIVIRQKEAWQQADGGWRRTYGFADGHAEIYGAADGNFGPWEAQHGPGSKPQ